MGIERKAANDEVSAGKLILVARRIRGYTQLELAEMYGVDVKTLRGWEKSTVAVSFNDVFGILNLLDLVFEDVKNVA